MAAARAAKKPGAAPVEAREPAAGEVATLSPSMVTAIKNSPKGKIPAGLAKYMAGKKSSKKVKKATKKGK